MHYELKTCLLPISQLSLVIAYDIHLSKRFLLRNIKELNEYVDQLSAIKEEDLFTKATHDTYEPIRKYFCARLIDDISSGRTKAELLTLHLDGSINPDKTYILDGEIFNWYELYDMSPGIIFDYEYTPVINNIFDGVTDLLENTQNDFLFKFSGIDKVNMPTGLGLEDWTSMFQENSYLKAQLSTNNTTLSSKKKTYHGNASRYSGDREEVLGAAMSCLASWPDQCKSSTGKVKGASLARLIEQKALLFWPQTGEPPISHEVMTRYLNDWLNKTV